LVECRITNVERDRPISTKKRVVNGYHTGKYTDVVDMYMIKQLLDTATMTKYLYNKTN